MSAVAGMGGIGKTVLARHCAALAADRDWFPGGVLFVDLRGYSPDDEQVIPRQVFAPALRLLGVPSGEVPATVDEQAAMYHQLLDKLASSGQRVLLVLDNAAAGKQVADLIPRQAAHRAIVTTRDVLNLPTAHRLDLDVLAVNEGLQLLTEILDQRSPGDSRVTQEPEPVKELIEACGSLPLAVTIAASILADDPELRIVDLVSELTAVDSPGAHTLQHGELNLASSFDVSWRRLHVREPEAANLLLLLTLNPGPDFSAAAAAALCGHSHAKAMTWLRTLRQASLLRQQEGRWSMHDLIRLHAGCRLDPDHKDPALNRLLAYLGKTAEAANAHLLARRDDPKPAPFSGRDAALAWFDDERVNLLSVLTLALESGRGAYISRFVQCLRPYLSWRRHIADLAAVCQQEATAAVKLSSRQLHTRALDHLAGALIELGRFDEGITLLRNVITRYREADNREGEGVALSNLGAALAGQQRFDEAIGTLQDAIATCREIGDRVGEGETLVNLGVALGKVGRFDEGVNKLLEAIAIHRETGDRNNEGKSLSRLGDVLRMAGHLHDAAAFAQEAIAIYRETGDRNSEGMALNSLARTQIQLHDLDGAVSTLRAAAKIHHKNGERNTEGLALHELALTQVHLKRFDDAIESLQASVAIHSETEDRQNEGTALYNLALTYAKVDRLDEAKLAAERALTALHESGDTRHADAVKDWLDDLP